MKVLSLFENGFIYKIKNVVSESDDLTEGMIFSDFQRDVFPLLTRCKNIQKVTEILKEHYLYNYIQDEIFVMTMIFCCKYNNTCLIKMLKDLLFTQEELEIFYKIALYYGNFHTFLTLEKYFSFKINPERLIYLRFAIFSNNYVLIEYYIKNYISFKLLPEELLYYPTESIFPIYNISKEMFNFLKKLGIMEDNDSDEIFYDHFMNFELAVLKQFQIFDKKELYNFLLEKISELEKESISIDNSDEIEKIIDFIKDKKCANFS